MDEMRLIDADRLLTDRMKSTYYHLPNGDIAIPIIDIEHAPTVDAVEVVRCKDCKYFVGDMEWCEADDEHPASPDAFCSWAERRSDE